MEARTRTPAGERPAAHDGDTPGVLAPPPLIYVGALAVGLFLEALLPSASLPTPLAWSLGGVLLLAGIALARVRIFSTPGEALEAVGLPAQER